MAAQTASGRDIVLVDQLVFRKQKSNSGRNSHEAVLQVEDDGAGKYTLVFITPKGNRVTVVTATV